MAHEDTELQRHVGKDTRTYMIGGDPDDWAIVPTPDIGWVAPSPVDATRERLPRRYKIATTTMEGTTPPMTPPAMEPAFELLPPE
jgi:hypothetical protein